MVRIALDIRGTRPGFRAHFGRGTGRYTTELAKRLFGKYPEGGDNTELSIEPLGPELLEGRSWERALLRMLPCGKQTAHAEFILPRQLRRLPFQLLHFPYHGDAPSRCPLRYCVTVLDLIPLRFPELYKPKRASWRFKLARKLELDAILNSFGIFAISEATKRDVVELLGIAAEKIIVTPLGVDSRFPPRSEAWEQEARGLRAKYALPEERPFLFYYGGIDPRKNVLFLLQIFKEALARNQQKKPILGLAGAYEKDPRFPELQQTVARLGLAEHVRLLGFVADDDLPSLLRASDVLLFPSLYEGFGLPVLEAMASGVPVIAGRNSSIREVMGRDELLAPDNDAKAWIELLEVLLTDRGRREEHSRWGLARAKEFSWEQTAAKTLSGYRHFLRAGANAGALDRANAQSPRSVGTSA